MICSKEVMSFFTSCENYVLDCSNDLVTPKKLYLSSIKNDQNEADEFVSALPIIKKQLKEDLLFFMDCDPAVDSEEEVILAYLL